MKERSHAEHGNDKKVKRKRKARRQSINDKVVTTGLDTNIDEQNAEVEHDLKNE